MMAKPPMLRSETPAQLEHRLINEGWYDRLPEPQRTENLARAARIMAKAPPPGVHKRDGIFAALEDNRFFIANIILIVVLAYLTGGCSIWDYAGRPLP